MATKTRKGSARARAGTVRVLGADTPGVEETNGAPEAECLNGRGVAGTQESADEMARTRLPRRGTRARPIREGRTAVEARRGLELPDMRTRTRLRRHGTRAQPMGETRMSVETRRARVLEVDEPRPRKRGSANSRRWTGMQFGRGEGRDPAHEVRYRTAGGGGKREPPAGEQERPTLGGKHEHQGAARTATERRKARATNEGNKQNREAREAPTPTRRSRTARGEAPTNGARSASSQPENPGGQLRSATAH